MGSDSMLMSIFDNTEIAFKSKSNADLSRSYWLFSLVKRPSWVRLGKFVTEAAFALRLPIEGLVKQTIFRQFCGGTAITDCAAAVNALGQFGMKILATKPCRPLLLPQEIHTSLLVYLR
jgi:hypothetical protein